jgi:hypothetical protein
MWTVCIPGSWGPAFGVKLWSHHLRATLQEKSSANGNRSRTCPIPEGVRGRHSVSRSYVGRVPFGLCAVRPGRFCCDNFLCNRCFDCCCEGNASDFVAYGSAVTTHFKLLKFLIGWTMAMAILATPSIVINSWGAGLRNVQDDETTALPELFSTTAGESAVRALRISAQGDVAGNLDDSINETHIELPLYACTPAIQRYPDCRVPKSHIAIFQAAMDTVIALLFLFGWVLLRRFVAEEDDRVDSASVQVADYSIFLPMLPSWFNAKRIHQHFDRVLNGHDRDPRLKPFRIAAINVVDDGFRQLGLFRNKARIDRQIQRVNNEIAATEIERQAFGDGCCACCGCSRSATITKLAKRLEVLQAEERVARRKVERFASSNSKCRTAELELEELEELKAAGETTARGCCGRNIDSAIASKQAEISQIRKAAAAAGKDPYSDDTGNTVAAFVVFEHSEDWRRAMNKYQSCCGSGCCQWGSLRIIHPDNEGRKDGSTPGGGGTPSSSRAVVPKPSSTARAAASGDLRPWEVPAHSKGVKVFGTVPLEVRDAPDPSTIIWENLSVGPCEQGTRRTFTTITALALLVGSFVALYFASLAKASLTSGQTLLACSEVDYIINATSTSTDSLLYRSPDNSFDPTLQAIWPTVQSYLQANDPTSPLLQASKRNDTMRNCYCQSIDWAELNDTALIEHPDAVACPQQYCPSVAIVSFDVLRNKAFCFDWIKEFLLQLALTIVAALAVVVVNLLLGLVIKALASFEAYYTDEDLQSSIGWKSLLAQFFNLALLNTLINAYFEGVSSPADKDRLYADFTKDWYGTVGVSLLLTLIIQIFSTNFAPLIAAVSVCCARRKELAATQEDLNVAYTAPPFSLTQRYASMFAFIAVVMMYSAGIPVLLWVVASYCILAYWADLYGFTSVYSTPPRSSNLLARTMVGTLPAALLIHLGVATWVFGNKLIFASDQALQDLLALAPDAGATDVTLQAAALQQEGNLSKGIDRVTTLYVIPLLLIFILILAIGILRAVGSVFVSIFSALLSLFPCCKPSAPKAPVPLSEAIHVAETVLPTLTGELEALRREHESAIERGADTKDLEVTIAELSKRVAETTKQALTTLPDYNLFRVPAIRNMFHLPESFANRYSQLCDLRHWTPEQADEVIRLEREKAGAV